MSNSSLLFKKLRKKTGKKSQKNSRLFLSTKLSSIRIVIGTKNVIVLRWYTIFFLQSEARVAWISSDCFESFSPLSIDVTEGVTIKIFVRQSVCLTCLFFTNLPALTKFERCYNYSIFDCHNPLSLTSFWRRYTRKVAGQPSWLGLEWVQNWRKWRQSS